MACRSLVCAAARRRRPSARALLERGRDLVVKLVDSRGGRGVQRMNAGRDAETAYAEAKAQSPTGRASWSRPIRRGRRSRPSRSCSTASAAHAGLQRPQLREFLTASPRGSSRTAAICPAMRHAQPSAPMSRRLSPPPPAPPRHRRAQLQGRHGRPRRQGACHRNRRAPVGRLFQHARDPAFSTGVDFIGAVMKLALGEPVAPADLTPRFERPIVQRYVFPSGRAHRRHPRRGRGARPARHPRSDAQQDAWRRHPARHLQRCARAAMVLATGATMVEARANAARAVSAIRF